MVRAVTRWLRRDTRREGRRRLPQGPIRIVLASGFFALLLGEGLVRLVAPQIFPVHPAGLYTPDPHVGYALAPGFRGELVRSEFRHAIHVGAEGLRDGDSRPRREDTVRALILGDSHAFGFGVGEDQTLAVQLERILGARFPEVELQVLNGAVPGYGTADQLAYLESRGRALDPDLVLVQFPSVNDLQENLSPARAWAVVTDGMLAHEAGGVPSRAPWLSRAQRWLKSHSHLGRLASDMVGYWMSRFGLLGQGGALWGEDFSTEAAELGIELLGEISETARSLDARTLYLYTTGQASVLQEEYEDLPSRAVVEAAAERASVPWVEVTAHLRERSDRAVLYYRRNGHWTAEGHRAVAEVVTEVIAQHDMLRL